MCEPLSIWKLNVKISMWELEILPHKERLQLLHTRYLIGYFFLFSLQTREGEGCVLQKNITSSPEENGDDMNDSLSFLHLWCRAEFSLLFIHSSNLTFQSGLMAWTSASSWEAHGTHISHWHKILNTTALLSCINRTSVCNPGRREVILLALGLQGKGCIPHPPHFCESCRTKSKVTPSVRKQEEENVQYWALVPVFRQLHWSGYII